MKPESILVAVVCGLVAIVVAVVLAIRIPTAKVPWQTTPAGVRYLGKADPNVLDQNVALCVELLLDTKLPTEAVESARAALGVYVEATDKWVDSYGRTVGGSGTAIPTSVQVGRDLTALCHEMAHAVEWMAYRQTDDEHAQWEARGIWTADNLYRAKMVAP